MVSGERRKRQHSVLSAEGGSDLRESIERESKARSKCFERPLRLRRNEGSQSVIGCFGIRLRIPELPERAGGVYGHGRDGQGDGDPQKQDIRRHVPQENVSGAEIILVSGNSAEEQ